MTRDDDFLRKLLFEAEASDHPYVFAVLQPSSDAEEQKRYAHIKWATDERLFEQEGQHAFRLTSQGQDYLAAIRNEGIWQTTTAAAAKAGGYTLRTMVDVSVAAMKENVVMHLKDMGYF